MVGNLSRVTQLGHDRAGNGIQEAQLQPYTLNHYAIICLCSKKKIQGSIDKCRVPEIWF